MKAVYAFYSKPFGGNIRKPSGKHHWALPYLEFLVMCYSAMKSKEFFGRTELHTDKYGAELIKEFGIPFDEIIVDLDWCEVKPRFWAAGKIYAYSAAQSEPFIMLDNDAGFHTKPPDHFMKSLYRCQSVHEDTKTVFEVQFQRLLRETKNEFPVDIFHEFKDQPLRGGNAGVVIMNDMALLGEFTRYTWALMESEFMDKVARENKRFNMYDYFSMWNVLVEENLLYLLSRRMNLQEPETVLDIRGFSIPEGHYNKSGYFHLWGKKKNINFIKGFEDIAINYIPKEISNKIIKYFNG